MSEPEGPPPTVTAVVTLLRLSERRRRLRLKFSRPAHVGSAAKYDRVEEVQTTVNVSGDGLYFLTSLDHYRVGMLTAVTFPYSPTDPVKTEEIGEVVRVEQLADGQMGIAIKFRIPPRARKAFQKGLERRSKEDPAGSLVHFQRAVAEFPSYYEAYHQMGLAYMHLGQAAQAEQALQKAIDLSQSRHEALFSLASLLSNNQRFSEAEPLARRGLELDGNSCYGQFELARALMGLNRVEAAQKLAEEARKRNPDYPQLHLLLANIHIRKHDYPALLEDLDSYLKLAPDSSTSDQARQRREEAQRALANNRDVPAAEASKP